jgi:hypothetical protein
MAPPSRAEPPAGTPELPVGATLAREGLARDGLLARPGQSARYFMEPNRPALASDPVDEVEARLILEMHHQEYVARRALEELFESGEAECLSI